LRTNAQVLRNADRLSSDDIAQITTDMVAQVDELAALVTDLAELARGERSEGDVVSVPLDELLEELVQTARTHARTKDITIDLVLDQPGTVMARRDRLSRAVNNLLGNAVKFTPRGGTVLVRVHDGALTIEDNGPGIRPEERARVFDRFWRSPAARSLPGSGLGLAIVAQVAHELNADISVEESTNLGGAKFTLSMPISKE
jgi:two-component system sensor histidine kinase MprB